MLPALKVKASSMRSPQLKNKMGQPKMGIYTLPLYGKSQSQRPDLPILLCTGFSHTMTEEKARELGIRKFLVKPLLRRDLVLALQEVMEELDTTH